MWGEMVEEGRSVEAMGERPALTATPTRLAITTG